jgi:multidrug efflux pump subunit AcrA (membrane-fusion protein)
MRQWSILAVAILAACSHAQPAPAPTPPSVQVSVAQPTAIAPSETLAGTAAPYQNVAIQETSLSEPALRVNVNEGDIVHRGDVLAVLNTDDLQASLQADLANAQSFGARVSQYTYQGVETISQSSDQVRYARAALMQAQQTLKYDQTNLVRDQQLYAKQYIAQMTLQQQQTQVRNDQQAVQSSMANLQSAISAVQANGTMSQGAQASNVQNSAASQSMALAQADQLRAEISRGTIVSPVDGVITNRNFNPGEYPGTRQIFTVQQLDPMYAVFQASGPQIVGVQNGAPVKITAVDEPLVSFQGKIVAVLGQVTPGSTNFIVKAVFHNPGYKLRAGMVVSGTLQESATRGIGIPATAFLDDSHTTVMTVGADGTLVTSKVQEIRTNTQTSIVTGLAAGTRVVTNGQLGLTPGQKVATAQ